MAFHRPVPGPGSGSGLHFLNSPFGDTTYTKVFVGGLAWETQSETLRRHFELFGEILEAVVITDKNTGRSKGYGFVTFRDPESARRACVDPSPIIDGRRANCNLASLGRPRSSLPYAQVRSTGPYYGGIPVVRGAYVGSPSYSQPIPYNYQQGFAYPPYGYAAYGPEYVYPQNVYTPYTGQQYIQVYGIPGTINTTNYPISQMSPTLPPGHGYAAVQSYTMPGHHLVQITGPNVSGATAAHVPAIQAYPAGLAAAPVQAQPQFLPACLALQTIIFAFLRLSIVMVTRDIRVSSSSNSNGWSWKHKSWSALVPLLSSV
ncbi:hypothetical protein J5N97_026146 [Dioscorea zingiberensis]|uniref:RRM domain-containing protein n=1 Tax=Dioscorea zingiberensis TaxID=325984 RepID=A0A9D5C2U0_9LILI|nr:hypothetical protein J5N97_026146 [Dioscorea zingiberensis]